MEGALRRSLGSQAQHTHSLEDHTWSIQQSTTRHTKHFQNIQQQNSNYTQTHGEMFHQQFTNTVRHATHKTNRHINRATHNIQGYNITLTTAQVQEAIKQSKNNNSQGSDKLNIRHLKHIDPLGLAFLTSMFKTALNKNIIPHTWKLANKYYQNNIIITKRIHNQQNIAHFRKYLKKTNWAAMGLYENKSISELFKLFMNTILHYVYLSFPLENKKIRYTNRNPWITRE